MTLHDTRNPGVEADPGDILGGVDPHRKRTIRLVIALGVAVLLAGALIYTSFSAATEAFVVRLGLLRNNVLRFRELLEIYRLTPVQTIAWVAKRSKAGIPVCPPARALLNFPKHHS